MKKITIVCLSLISIASALSGMPAVITDDNLETMPRVFGCVDLVKQANEQLSELEKWIMSKKEEADRSQLASKEDQDKRNKSVESHIRNVLKEVKQLVEKAEKEAGFAL